MYASLVLKMEDRHLLGQLILLYHKTCLLCNWIFIIILNDYFKGPFEIQITMQTELKTYQHKIGIILSVKGLHK